MKTIFTLVFTLSVTFCLAQKKLFPDTETVMYSFRDMAKSGENVLFRTSCHGLVASTDGGKTIKELDLYDYKFVTSSPKKNIFFAAGKNDVVQINFSTKEVSTYAHDMGLKVEGLEASSEHLYLIGHEQIYRSSYGDIEWSEKVSPALDTLNEEEIEATDLIENAFFIGTTSGRLFGVNLSDNTFKKLREFPASISYIDMISKTEGTITVRNNHAAYTTDAFKNVEKLSEFYENRVMVDHNGYFYQNHGAIVRVAPDITTAPKRLPKERSDRIQRFDNLYFTPDDIYGMGPGRTFVKTSDNFETVQFFNEDTNSPIQEIVMSKDGIGGAVKNGDLIVTNDRGATWKRFNSLSDSLEVYDVTMRGNDFIITSKEGLYGVKDGKPFKINEYSPNSIHYDKKSNVLFGITTRKIFRSTDLGQTWDFVFEPSDRVYSNLMITPKYMYVSVVGAKLARSSDGINWEEIQVSVNNLIQGVLLNEDEEGFVYTGNVLYKMNGDWSELEKLNNSSGIQGLTRLDDLLVYASTPSNRTYITVSEDNGKTWTSTFSYCSPLTKMLVSQEGRVLMGTRYGEIIGMNLDLTSANDNVEQLSSDAVHPNPVASGGQLQLSKGFNEYKYTIVNINGQEVASGQVHNASLSVPQLHQGLYVLMLSNNDQLKTLKLSVM